MSSLKDIRGRIMSVKETLKITSAMRMISSAKMQGSLNAVASYSPYVDALTHIYSVLSSACRNEDGGVISEDDACPARQAVVLITSNQSLCGSFNANVMKCFEDSGFIPEKTDVLAVGKYGLKAARKAGFEVSDFCSLANAASFDDSLALTDALVTGFAQGKWGRVSIVYSHFVSRARQETRSETFLPFVPKVTALSEEEVQNYIYEPAAEEALEQVLPELMKAQLYLTLLDAGTSEHAARTLAMQIASDNACDLLGELSVLYNKLRQQQITNELLDIVGGQVGK